MRRGASPFGVAAIGLGLAFLYAPIVLLVAYSFNDSRLVTVPLSAPGIVAGALLCFIPIVGEFVIPDLLGGSGAQMIGQTLWTEFFSNKDWPVAAAVAVALLVILLVPIVIYQHLQMRDLERR